MSRKVSELSLKNNFDGLRNDLVKFNDPDIAKIIQNFQLSDLQKWAQASLEAKANNENIVIDFHRNGMVFQGIDKNKFLESFIKDYRVFENQIFSMRMTNLQLINEPIRNFVKKMANELGVILTCNMYLTSSPDGTCFTFHTDNQISLIAQLSGEKHWLIPKDENGYMYTTTNPNALKPNYENCDEFIIQKGDQFCVGHNVIHKAFNKKNQISAHLTFASSRMNHLDVIQNLLLELDDFVLAEDLIYKYDISDNSIRELLGKFKNKIQSINENKVIQTVARDEMQQSIQLARIGRKY